MLENISKGAAIGSGSGAACGLLTWLVVGTIGVVTGGSGIGLGLLGQALVGGVVGGVAGATVSTINK